MKKASWLVTWCFYVHNLVVLKKKVEPVLFETNIWCSRWYILHISTNFVLNVVNLKNSTAQVISTVKIPERQLEFINSDLGRLAGESMYAYLSRIRQIALPSLSEHLCERIGLLAEHCRYRHQVRIYFSLPFLYITFLHLINRRLCCCYHSEL